VHCNFVIDKSVHRRMKLLSLKRGITLRQIVNEAMTEYLERNGK
jgi:predicted HicB family RNase H-like nuclease